MNQIPNTKHASYCPYKGETSVYSQSCICGRLAEEIPNIEETNTREVEEMAIFMHQAFQRAKPHDYHKPFEETDNEYKRVMKSIASEIIENQNNQLQKAREEEREKFKEVFEEELRSNRANLPYYRYIARWKEELFDHSNPDQNTTK